MEHFWKPCRSLDRSNQRRSRKCVKNCFGGAKDGGERGEGAAQCRTLKGRTAVQDLRSRQGLKMQ